MDEPVAERPIAHGGRKGHPQQHAAPVDGRQEGPHQAHAQQCAGRRPAQDAHEAASLMRQRCRLPGCQQQRLGRAEQCEARHDEQQRQQHAGPIQAGHLRIAPGAPRLRDQDGQRRHDALQHDADGNEQAFAKAARSQRVAAQAAQHHGVGNAHRHLRQLRNGQRAGQTQRLNRVMGKAADAYARQETCAVQN